MVVMNSSRCICDCWKTSDNMSLSISSEKNIQNEADETYTKIDFHGEVIKESIVNNFNEIKVNFKLIRL